MSIPDYQRLLLPLLEVAGDRQGHSLRDAVDILAQQFGLSDEERRTLLPSGRQPTFENRVGWARTYLKKAGLLNGAGRGKFQITARGSDVLKSNPSAIDVRYLERFPEFIEFKGAPGQATQVPGVQSLSVKDDPASERKTPEELVEESFQRLQQTLARELADMVATCSPAFFERLVVDLLLAMGYGGSRREAGEAVGQSGDGGIDGIIKEDRLGLDSIYIQAKRWDSPVGRPVVQAFVGSLEGFRSRKGVFITTSSFTKEARSYVQSIEKKVVLIDGAQLLQFMIEHNIGVNGVATYTLKKVDRDYFEGDGSSASG